MRNFDWSEAESSNPITYSNMFGEVVLTPVTAFMPVSEITRENFPVINEVLVSVDQAEQVTLITDNRRVCMNFCFPLLPEDKATYAIKYSCKSRGAVCRIVINNFVSPGNVSAQAQIEDMAPKINGPMPVF
jgi:hypothetical protein